MLRFIAVHPIVFGEEQLKTLAQEPIPEGVTWKSTFCAFDDNRSYCHWEAPSRDAVTAIFAKYEIPYEALHEVRLFDPATGELEAAPMEKMLQPA